jgi:hypothetical protein
MWRRKEDDEVGSYNSDIKIMILIRVLLFTSGSVFFIAGIFKINSLMALFGLVLLALSAKGM